MLITFDKINKKFILRLESSAFTTSNKDLVYKSNCCEESDLTGQVSPVTVLGISTYEIPWNGLDGIHSFSLTELVAGVVYTERACFFVHENILCVIAQYIADESNKNSNIPLLFNIIKESINCNCNCEDLCKIYKTILLELNLIDRCKIC